MTDTEFITARFPENEMPKTQSRAEMRVRLRGFIKGQARIREAGGEYGPWRTENEAIERVMTRVDKMGVGPKLIVQRKTDNDQLSIREVAVKLSIPELHANPHIEKSHGLTWAEFHDLRSGGLWLCRNIDGTNTVSRHGYLDDDPPDVWKGAAEDTFVTSGGMDHLEEVAHFKVAKAKEGILNLDTVIVNRTIWTAPDFNPRAYTGNQHFHVHEDAPGGHPCNP